MKELLELINISKTYGSHHINPPVLNNFNLVVYAGEILSIMGKSGSGKSTLLNIIGAIDQIDKGEYLYEEERVDLFNTRQLTEFRRKNIGFVVQHFALIDDISVFDNIALPMRYNRKYSQLDIKKRVVELLELLNLSDKIKEYPNHLSGGEIQRVAIARALAVNPKLILADEPTGSLDEENQQVVLDTFRQINSEKGVTIIIVTHDYDIANTADRIIELKR